jgi:hypothetical protein
VAIPALFFFGGEMKEKQPLRKKNPVRTIETMLGKIEDKLVEDFKFTVGDYIKLLQLHEELEGDEPKNIEVTWTDVLEPSGFGK